MSEPIVTGRFTVYETPSGGYHIVYRGDNETENDTHHLDIPPALVTMARKAMKMGTVKI